jgi:tetratricopeptide (TPR) repeat protein
MPLSRAVAGAAVVGLALLLASPARIAAQPWAGRAILQGSILDEHGAPVAGARVTIRAGSTVDAAAPGPAPELSNADGRWAFSGLAAGAWAMRVEKEGYATAEGPVRVDAPRPTPPVTVTLRRPVAPAAAGEPAGAIRAAIEAGNALLAAAQWRQARQRYEEALALITDPGSRPPVLRAIAQTYSMERDDRRALEWLERARATKADDPETLNMLAQVQQALGRPDLAIASLAASLSLRDDPTTTRQIVDLLVAAGRDDEARAYHERLGSGAKVDPTSLLNAGIRHYNERAFDRALQSFERAVRENPELAEGYYYRALARRALGRADEAEADLRRFLDLAPDHAKAADARAMLDAQ